MNASVTTRFRLQDATPDDVRSIGRRSATSSASAAPYALPARSMGTSTANGQSRLPERFSPNSPHRARRLPRGVTVNVMMTSAAMGAKALSSTLMPAWGSAVAMPMAREKASTR